MTRRLDVIDAIHEKARHERSLALDDFRLVVLTCFHGLQYDTGKQFVTLNGFITPGMAKKRKVEPTGEDNGRAHSDFFEGLVNKASLQELGAWLVELALIHYRDHTPYSYYEGAPKQDPLFETAHRWGLDIEAIKTSISEPAKSSRTKAKHGAKPGTE